MLSKRQREEIFRNMGIAGLSAVPFVDSGRKNLVAYPPVYIIIEK